MILYQIALTLIPGIGIESLRSNGKKPDVHLHPGGIQACRRARSASADHPGTPRL